MSSIVCGGLVHLDRQFILYFFKKTLRKSVPVLFTCIPTLYEQSPPYKKYLHLILTFLLEHMLFL